MLLVSFYFFEFVFEFVFQFFLILFWIYFLNFLNIFWYIFFIFLFLICLCRFHLPMICPWSACNLQGPPCKMRQKFCTCEFFSIFQKSRKIAENAKKKWFFVPFFVNKNRVFLEAKFPKMHYKNHHFLYIFPQEMFNFVSTHFCDVCWTPGKRF